MDWHGECSLQLIMGLLGGAPKTRQGDSGVLGGCWAWPAIWPGGGRLSPGRVEGRRQIHRSAVPVTYIRFHYGVINIRVPSGIIRALRGGTWVGGVSRLTRRRAAVQQPGNRGNGRIQRRTQLRSAPLTRLHTAGPFTLTRHPSPTCPERLSGHPCGHLMRQANDAAGSLSGGASPPTGPKAGGHPYDADPSHARTLCGCARWCWCVSESVPQCNLSGGPPIADYRLCKTRPTEIVWTGQVIRR